MSDDFKIFAISIGAALILGTCIVGAILYFT